MPKFWSISGIWYCGKCMTRRIVKAAKASEARFQ
jgi:hypothetical protein